MNRPTNNVLAFADDWGRFASAYRDMPGASQLNELISTPIIEHIAREGVLFANALVAFDSLPLASS
jgi:N-sulfoglucosamine sulfohydrolase